MPEHKYGADADIPDFEAVVTEKEAQNVKRVTDVDELKDYFAKVIRESLCTNQFDPEYGFLMPLQDIAEKCLKNIETITQLVRECIVWGVYGQTGELVKIARLKGKVERLEPGDAKNYKTLYLMGLQEIPQNFGDTYEEVREQTTQDFRKMLEERYVVGVGFKYRDDRGNTRKKLAGTARVIRRTGTRAHIADFRTLYVDPVHRGKELAKMLTDHRLKYVAREGFDKVHLIVTATNREVIRANLKMGFVIRKIEPNAAKITRRDAEGKIIETVYFDWVHMELDVQKYKEDQAAKLKETEVQEKAGKEHQFGRAEKPKVRKKPAARKKPATKSHRGRGK